MAKPKVLKPKKEVLEKEELKVEEPKVEVEVKVEEPKWPIKDINGKKYYEVRVNHANGDSTIHLEEVE